MAKIIIELNDGLLGTVFTRIAHQQITIDTFIADSLESRIAPAALPLKKNVNMPHILEAALEKAAAYAVGEKFYLDDLIPPAVWDSMSAGKRKSLGKIFRKEAAKRHVAQHNGRTSGNKAIYIREATKGKMFSIYLPLALAEKLDHISEQTDKTPDTVIREALSDWISNLSDQTQK